MLTPEMAEPIVRVLRAEPPHRTSKGRNVARNLMYFVRNHVPPQSVNTAPEPELIEKYSDDSKQTYLDWCAHLHQTISREADKLDPEEDKKLLNVMLNALRNLERGLDLAERRAE